MVGLHVVARKCTLCDRLVGDELVDAAAGIGIGTEHVPEAVVRGVEVVDERLA